MQKASVRDAFKNMSPWTRTYVHVRTNVLHITEIKVVVRYIDTTRTEKHGTGRGGCLTLSLLSQRVELIKCTALTEIVQTRAISHTAKAGGPGTPKRKVLL